MLYRALADAILVLHLAFIVFVIGGGWLVFRSRRVAWLHVPAVVWAVLLELCGWICPLTPLENDLRSRAGATPYREGFIEHYLLPIVYPTGLTREIQLVLGVAVLLMNVCVYLWLWRRSRKRPDE